jgi:acid phosphatase type 7
MTSQSGPIRSADGARRARHGNRVLVGRPGLVLVAGVALAAASLALGLVVSGAFTSRHEIVATAPVRASIPLAAAASVFATAPTANHGAVGTLRVDSSPIVRSYVRFDLSRLRGKVTSATLSFGALAANPVGLAVHVAPGGWTEDQITYANAPRPRARIGLSGPLSAGIRSSMNVTPFARGRRELDLALVGISSQQIALAGRERGALAPRLIVWVKGGAGPVYAGRPSPGHGSGGTGDAGPATSHASLAAAAKAATTGGMAPGRGHNPLVAAAGDIACDPTTASFRNGNGTTNSCHERVVSEMLLRIHPAAALPLGDEQYKCGDLSSFRRSYGPTWGRLMAISHPVPGNHEYGEACGRSSAAGYFRYFGAAAASFGRGWYSYNLGRWHMIALNSECSYGRGRLRVGGCNVGSQQERWLRRDLAKHPRRCTMAYWHEPRFSSGEHGDAQQMARIWNDLARAHADVVLSGHNHDYERFEPAGAEAGAHLNAGPTLPPNYQNPLLRAGGMREFVVGTGGKNHYPFFHPPLRGEVVRNSDTYGLLLLRLRARGYSWRFVPEPGKTFTDSGSAWCPR